MSLFSSSLWFNLLWLNIRRFKKMWFWRLLVFLTTLLMIVLSGFLKEKLQLLILCGLFLTTQLLFINLKIHLESRTTAILLRSLGASRGFLVLNNLIEFFLPVFVGILMASGVGLFMPKDTLFQWKFFWITTLEGLGIILFVTPFITLYLIHQQERYLKEL